MIRKELCKFDVPYDGHNRMWLTFHTGPMCYDWPYDDPDNKEYLHTCLNDFIELVLYDSEAYKEELKDATAVKMMVCKDGKTRNFKIGSAKEFLKYLKTLKK